jgi:uncharacterized protein YegP (UPF0339 family)
MYNMRQTGGMWTWELLINGNIVAQCPSPLKTKAACMNAIRLVKMSFLYPVS